MKSIREQLIAEISRQEDPETFQNIVDAGGFDLNEKGNDGRTILIHACRGSGAMFGLHLLTCENPAPELDIQDNEGKTALMYAVSFSNYFVVGSLIRKGADANIQDHNGQTALMRAAEIDSENKAFIFNMLMSDDAHLDVDLADNDGHTALMLIAKHDSTKYGPPSNQHKDKARALIAKGAKLDKTDKNGKTALQLAEEAGNDELAEIIRNRDVGVQQNNQQNTLFDLIRNGSSLDAVRRAARTAGDDADKLNDLGMVTPLIEAAANGRLKIVELLIHIGVDVNKTNDAKYTALMNAATKNHADIVELLIKNGADVTLKNHHGETAAQRIERLISDKDKYTAVLKLLKDAEKQKGDQQRLLNQQGGGKQEDLNAGAAIVAGQGHEGKAQISFARKVLNAISNFFKSIIDAVRNVFGGKDDGQDGGKAR